MVRVEDLHERLLPVKLDRPLTVRQLVQMVEEMEAFDCQIAFHIEDLHMDAKSLLGMAALFAQVHHGETAIVTVKGPDRWKAMHYFAARLPEAEVKVPVF